MRQSLTPVPEDAKGLLYVATNKPIPVGVEGTEAVAKEDVGGYYLVHKRDWQALMHALRERRADPTGAAGR